MKRHLLTTTSSLFFAFILLISCSEDESFRQKSYEINPGDGFEISGTITVSEITDGIKVSIDMEGGIEGAFHPAHLHFGKWVDNGLMAAMLNPIDGTTGKSETEVKILTDDSNMTFDRFLEFDGSFRIHPDDGENRKVVMGYADIGVNELIIN